MNIIQLVQLGPALWKFAREMTKLLEQMIPNDGFGNTKIAAFDRVLRAVIAAASNKNASAEEAVAELGKVMAETAVDIMNTTGELKQIADEAKTALKATSAETEAVIAAAIEEANNAIGS